MNPRDISTRQAMIIGRNAVEVMDVNEFLCSQNWSASQIVSDIPAGRYVMRSYRRPFDLVVLSASHANPEGAAFIRSCLDEGCPMIVVNGSLAMTQAGRVVLVTRPFIDTDLIAALSELQLAAV